MKKLFLTLTMLLFAFTGVMRAGVDVEVGTASTTSTYLPDYTYYDYHVSQQIYTAAEIGLGGTINAISFDVASGSATRSLNVFMKHVTRSSFTSNSNWEVFAADEAVFSGDVTWGAGWVTITLDTPFEYNGTDNLLVCVQDVTGAYVSSPSFRVYNNGSNTALYKYRDGTPLNLSSMPNGTRNNYKNHIKLNVELGPATITADVNPVDLGNRPNGAWMKPATFNLVNVGNNAVVTAIESSNAFFGVTSEVPFNVNFGEPVAVEVTTGTGEIGDNVGQLMVIYADRSFTTIDVTASAYAPVDGDVWEKAITVTDMPFQGNAPAGIFKNYDLPTATAGADAVYKVTFDEDVLFSAGTPGDNAAAAIYTEDFQGVGGPSVDNNYEYIAPEMPEIPSVEYTYDFETADLMGWSTVDADGDGETWESATPAAYGMGSAHSGTYCASSWSWNNYSMDPDNWMISPMVEGAASIQYYVATNNSYPDHYGVYASSTGTNTSDFTLLFDETAGAKGGNGGTKASMTNGGSRDMSTWAERNIELPAGTKYVAFRHWNSYDNNYLFIDDVTITCSAVRGNRDAQTILEEGFEGGSMPTGWSRTGSYWQITSGTGYGSGYTGAANGSYNAGCYINDYSVTDILVTPEMDLSAATSATLNFNLWNTSWGGDINTFSVLYRVDGGDWNTLYTTSNQVSSWLAKEVELTGLAANYQLGFKVESNWSYGTAIDDVLVTAEISSGGGGPQDPVYQIADMFVPAGTYYVVVASTTDNFQVDMAVADAPVPEPAIAVSPADGAVNVASPVTLLWQLGAYTTEYQVLFGTQYPPVNVLVDWTDELATSALAGELVNNQSYFWQVNERNASGTTNSEIFAFTTAIDPVEGFAVENDSLYPGDAAVFTWEANRSFKGYNLYCDGVKVNESLITTNTYAVEGLEYNMEGYNFQVSAVYDAGESALSDVVTVTMTGNGTVSGYVYDTDVDHPVAFATVGFLGLDEYMQETYTEFTTDEEGFFTGELLAGLYAAGVISEGYATEAGAQVVAVEYGQSVEDLVFITHEFYYPLNQITATLQEEENNVKVEWSWIPAEMIVDFESGDFSQANFNLPASYPWAITTVNPHEGTYCMKSTCEGQASGTSTIEVTVDVPVDGKMGFWVRVSCEANYDKFHFYIDGVEKGAAISGQQPYAYKEFDITEGTHTYKWEYAKDSSVNSNDDCVYVDDITLYRYVAPLPPVVGATSYDFEDGTMMGWTSIDADNDGYGWVSSSNPGQYHNSGVSLSGTGHDASEAYVISGSYSNSAAIALTPDNYLVSPAAISAEAGAQIQFWVCAQDASYAAEHFGVAVSTTTATASAFTTVQEWTLTAKSGQADYAERAVRGTKEQGAWYQYSVDLSAYAGQDIWVAIRHFNCTDMFILNLDDITLATGGTKGRGDSRSLMSYNLYRRDVQHGEATAEIETVIEGINSDVYEYIDEAWANLPYGEYQWGIAATYDGYAPTERNRETATFGFENGLEGWTGIVVNTDGGEWIHSDDNLGGYDYTELAHTGTGFAMCYSYVDYDGPYDTDAYLVSPQKYSVDANSSISFWADNANDDYPENFSVCVSTAETPTAASFTQVWSGGAKGTGNGGAAVRRSDNRYENWRSHEVSLAAYAGQEVWIAFHDVNYDMYEIWIDDVTITYAGSAPVPPTPGPVGNGISEILWSNTIVKDMEATLTFNVTLNNGQSPVGAAVLATDGGDYSFNTTVGADGTAELEVRKGIEYTITVELEGYSTYSTTDFIEANQTYDVTLDEIIGAVDGLYVSPTGWAMWEGAVAGGGVNPTPVSGSNSFTEGFEGGLNGWNVLTVNTDGGEWIYSDNNLGGYDYSELAHTGTGFAMCYSYVDYDGPYDTDSYLYTPQKYAIENGSTLTFWADNANDSYPENFSVCVATADNPTAADFTQVWSGGAKGTGSNGAVVRHNNARYENWRSHNIDLSAYAGQEVYIAFHDVNYDAYEIWIDDVELAVVNKGDRAPIMYKVMLDGKYDGETTNPFFQHNVEGLEEGSTHTTAVRPVYVTGNGDWMTYDWTYTSCENFAGVEGLAAAAQGDDVKLTWTLPGGVNPGPNPNPNPGTPESFNFDDGTFQGWTTIDANNDGYDWVLGSQIGGVYLASGASLAGSGHNASQDLVCSGSYSNATNQAITPDNYLVSPAKAQYSNIKFYACAQDASYAAEHYGVAVSTNGNTSASDFTIVQEWTMTAKGQGATSIGRDGQMRAQGSWYEKTVDLSAYAGQEIWVAIRHFNCNDMFILDVDDITLNAPAKGNRAMWDLVFQFDGTSGYQYGVASDGTNIYTSSWSASSTSMFYKYDMQGNFIEEFNISGCGQLRGMTYDGEYFYGVANASTIYCVDLANHTLVSQTSSAYGAMRAITYDPERDGFWVVGNWSGDLTLVSRTGAIVQAGATPTSASDVAYYKDPEGVEHVYCFNNGDNGVYDYNIANNTIASAAVFNFNTNPVVTGSSGGCFVGTYDGKTCFFGDIQQSPQHIAIYELDANGTPNPNPNPQPAVEGILGAMIFRDGEWIAFVEGDNASQYVDAGAAANDAVYGVRVVYGGAPDTTYYAMSCPETVEYVGTGVSCDPVTNLTAEPYTYNGEDGALVSFTEPAGATSYKVYVDGGLLGSINGQPIFIGFGDEPDDTYEIGIVAVYPDCESDMATVMFEWTEIGENEIVSAIYPNPTNSNVTVKAAGMNHITVVNALGQVMYDADVDADELQLNLGQYNAGIYMVRISTVNGVSTQRVIVTK